MRSFLLCCGLIVVIVVLIVLAVDVFLPQPA